MLHLRLVRVFLFWLGLQLLAGLAEAACENPVARLFDFRNSVQIREASVTSQAPAVRDMAICVGDAVLVGERSRARLVFLVSGETFVIDQNSEFVVQRADNAGALIRILRGALLFFSRGLRPLDVETPFVNAAVEGTEFVVRVEQDRTVVTVIDGLVRTSNPQGMLVVGAGQQVVANQGQAPQLQIIVRPQDAVQWALYYEPVLPADSLAALDQIPEPDRDARFYLRRASVLLGVGRLDEARADIDQALKLAPDNGDAYGLQAVIAIALNDRPGALENGRRAVAQSPQSSAARIALSYALQASFQLEAARDELLQAVETQPNDGRAWARLAELWLSLGYLDRAQDAAERAVSLPPELARTNAVLGFAALARIDINGARAAFERAISLESDSPLARLGLGLAKIRAGDLAEGRGDIEIAATISPDDAIVRSYLGKAYYEEKREPLAGRELDLAKRLDPLDPTAYFYDAIRKQTLNRPVEALQDLQRSIELNDNRAVYRLRFLLDGDFAARSASLGRIYRDLGFEQLALVEGSNSVMADPSDYSGHRLLADTYSALPRHETARVSELLQAQLLQPINITPLQPQLAETDLFILHGAGPSDPAFNEFHPLFARDSVHFQANGIAGGNDTAGDDLVLFGLYRRLSFSAGQFHYETKGFRENNDQSQDIYNLFVQASVSPRTTVQAEIRHRDADRGDLPLRFDPDLFISSLRQKEDAHSTRVGVHHAVAPNADLIGSVIYQSSDANSQVSLSSGLVEFNTKEDGYIAEAQYLFRATEFSLITGIGHFSSDRTDEDFVFAPPATVTETDVRHTNFYAYPQLTYPRSVHWTFGASVDLFEGLLGSRNQFNPKFGVSWDVLPSTRLRAAAFRILERTLISDMTVEPTQVAGFNQFFRDGDSTESWRYGIGLDHDFSRVVHGGVELSERTMDIPFQFFAGGPTPEIQQAAWKEAVGRAFLYWAPHPWLAASADFQYERFRRPVEFVGPDLFTELDTYQLPLAVNVFHPSGFTARLLASRVNQSGLFSDPTGESFLPQESQFWVADASVGYRLPRRWGLLTLAVKNLFDKEFQMQDTDAENPRISPSRVILARFALTF